MSTTPSAPAGAPPAAPLSFTPYQRFATGLLTLLQFAVILDFMIMSPLGAMIMPALDMTASQFGQVVSGYAFSAGIAGLLTAGFADRYDRKRLLLFFYAGFLLGTLWCGLATSFEMLLAARIVTGLFGGVIGSIVMAITADIFAPALRGRVMGLLQGGFAASQVLGLPFGLFLANHWGWHSPFLALVALGVGAGVLIVVFMRPVNAHLHAGQTHSASRHLLRTLLHPRHAMAFAVTALLTTGGFMLMPFASAFVVHNVEVPLTQLPWVYLATGIATLIVSPMVGRLADRHGTMPVFYTGCVITAITVTIYTHLGPSSLITLILLNIVMFVGIFSRIIPWQAMAVGIPAPEQRGAFTAINTALQQLAGGVASLAAGHLVTIGADGRLHDFPIVGYVVVSSTALAAVVLQLLRRRDAARAAKG